MAKEYAPLLKTEIFEYDAPKHAFVSNTSEDMYEYVYCEKCHKWHKKDSPSRYGDDEYLCPECKNHGKVLYAPSSRKNGASYPISAKIFTMEDGSRAISVLIRTEYAFWQEKAERPMYGFDTARVRYVFSSNGHTYFKPPVYIDNGKQMLSGEHMKDITYVNSKSMYPYWDTCVEPIIKAGLLPERYNLHNRFRNLSDKFIEAIDKRLWEFCPKMTKKLLSAIGMNDDDIMAIRHMRDTYRTAPKSKRFTKALMKDPLGVMERYTIFRHVGLKDINSFWALMKDAPDFLESWEINRTKNLVKLCIKKHGDESVIVKSLIKDQGIAIFRDTTRYVKDLQSMGLTDNEIMEHIRPSIKKTHDNLMNLYNEIQKKERAIRNEESIRENVERYIHAAEQGDIRTASITKKVIIDKKLEGDLDIEYKDNEKRYEMNVDGVRFFLPRNTADLRIAGEHLHNCVGHYYVKPTLFRNCTIVLMERQERLCGCIEVTNGKIRQAFAPCNKDFVGEDLKAYEKWESLCGFAHPERNTCTTPERTGAPQELLKSIWDEVVEEYGLQGYSTAA